MNATNEAYNGPVYAGRILRNTGDGFEATPLPDDALSAEEMRERIIAEAHQQADAIRAERMSQLEAECDAHIAKQVLKATKSYNLSMESASSDILAVVESAVRKIIGSIPDHMAMSQALHEAIRANNAGRDCEIHAGPEAYSKLVSAKLEARSDSPLDWLKITEEPGLSAERCILVSGNRRLEISVEAQLNALKNALILDDGVQTTGAA